MDDEILGVSVGAARTCAVMPPRSEEWKNFFEENKDSPLINEEPKVMGPLTTALLNVLTRDANGLRIPSTFEETGIDVIGLQECRLLSQLVVREGFVMVTSEAEDGRDGCGLWLSTRRVGTSTSPLSTAPPRCSWWRFVPRRSRRMWSWRIAPLRVMSVQRLGGRPWEKC